MIRQSNATTINDGRSPLERLKAQPFILGLFLPTQSGGWTPSLAPRGTSWDYDYNAKLTVRADELGFDLVFALAQWLGKGGYGGKSHYREQTIDPLITTAGLASLTRNIVLISTVHVLYGWHPLHLAKMGATIDHMSGGRWGLNVVTGYVPTEAPMFGLEHPEHDKRYVIAAEFLDAMQQLWHSDVNITFDGAHYQMKDAFVTPKPRFGRPIVVNAGSSDAGLDFAARHSDLLFITSPAGAEFGAAVASLPAFNAHIKARGAEMGRKVTTIINPHIICRETEKEARDAYRAIADQEDAEAVDNLMQSFTKGDNKSFRGHKRDQRIVGGNIQMIGTPEQIVDGMLRLKRAGCDGVQVNFFDFEPDIEFFGNRILPLMRQAGLRNTA
ncbi:MAG: LLM class flavin-dependent oxidoreductase [Rhodospirillales bacterium]